MNEKILYKELSYKIVGIFYTVYNELGSGFKEIVYHKALEIEFKLQKISYEEKKRIQIRYKNQVVGIYEPDFVVDEKILIELKAIPGVSKVDEQQLYNYLKGTNYKLGYLVNFGANKLEIKRRVYDTIRGENSH